MNYIEMFKNTAEMHAGDHAVADRDGFRVTTYAELDTLSGRVSGKLRAMGCSRGDFIIICMGRCMEYLAAYLGVLKAGCVVVPVIPDYPEERIGYISKDCNAGLTVKEDFFSDIEKYSCYEDPADDREPALLVYTSGSTGTPKGIIHSAGDLARTVSRQRKMFEGIDPLVFGASGQLSFAVHTFEYLTVFYLGGTSHILSDNIRKSAAGLAHYYEEHGITVGWIVPQMLRIFRNTSSEFKCALAGGERLSGISPDGFRIQNVYGMSEFAGIVTSFFPDRAYENTPIGKTIGELEVFVADGELQPVADGCEGEICVKGRMDVEYFNDPQRTAVTMIKTPDGETVLRTGDIGYIDGNGDLVFVNRKDWMVKVNGQRVETLELEVVLQSMPEIENAAVKAFEDEIGQTYLTAYFVPGETVSESKIRAFLRHRLPEYMLPRFLVRMDALPQNDNGKLNRLALLPPDRTMYKTKYADPRNETESMLCRCFESVLNCGRVGADDNFFSLGGDSIKVLHLINAAGIPSLTPDIVLKGKTPRGIAAACNTEICVRFEHSGIIPQTTPLTEAQKGVYLQCITEPDSLMYNIPMICRLPEDIDTGRFVCAVKQAAQTHKALQTTICAPGGIPSMLFSEKEITVTEKTVDSLEKECSEFVKPFDLENGPLYRFELCKSSEGNAFLFDIHHIVFDGSSVQALISCIAKLYRGESIDEETLTQFDVSAAEQTLYSSEEYTTAQHFFKEKLEGVEWDAGPISDVVEDKPLPGAGRIVISSEQKFNTMDVSDFTGRNGFTENTLFLAAFAYTLAKFNGSQESTFCTVDNGRHDPRLSDSVGMFVKTLPMVFSFDEGAAVPEVLSAVQDDFFRTMSHDCISFGELATEYGANTDVVFVYQSELFDGADFGNSRIAPEFLETGDAQSDLDFMMIKKAGGYELQAHYRKGLYSETLVRNLAGAYLCVVKEMLTAEKLSDISLTDSESRVLLDGYNHTEVDWNKDKTVVELFRAQAEKTPENICLVFNGIRYTYREIDRITDRLAKYLVTKGVGREKVVGVLIPRSEYMLICSLGVLKAGGAYMPLDPGYPSERLNLMMQDSGAVMLISAPELDRIIDSGFTGERLSTDEIFRLEDCGAELPVPAPEDLFVLLYTSGSTGIPKGVEFAHSNALVSIEYFKRYFEMDESTHLASYASYGFDAHVVDIYPPVVSGGELHIIGDDIRLDLSAVRDYFNDNGITHCVMTTQVGRQFAVMGGHKTLKHLSVAGEKLTPLDPPAGLCFHNLYGPTEGSVITSAFTMTRRYTDVPVGGAVDNLKLYVTDKKGSLLPAGAVGELWIAGPHVTRGYRNRPDKTEEAYGTNPFSDEPGYGRVYRTGDIVRLLGDGSIQFVGRRDSQVKVRGFRVELTEIEEVIRRFDGIKDAAVVAYDEPSGGKYICAYVVSDIELSVEAVSDFVRGEKPSYMVPAVIMQIDAIPLNQNQKVNKKALPVPERKAEDTTPPENAMQRRIFDIAAEIMGHNSFGVYTGLYEAGLTSIGAVRLNVALSDEFGVPVRIGDIRKNDTVKKLEEFLAEKTGEDSFPLQSDYPLTETQNGIFVECMANPGTTVYNIPVLLQLGEGLDLLRLKNAVESAIDAHPYVKTCLFTDAEGNVRAKRQDDVPSKVDFVKCDILPDRTELRKPFNLIGEPLYRAAVYDSGEGCFLYMDFHHIISDGTSEAVILRDIDRAYSGESLKSEVFSGYEAALAEEKLRGSKEYESAKLYWTALLSGNDGTSLPQKMPETAERGAGYFRRTGENNADRIIRFCEDNRITLNAFFNAVFSLVLGRFTARDSVNYATIYNGRNDSRLASAVTMLVKTLPVTADIGTDIGVKDYILNIQSQLMSSMSNEACSFAELATWFGVDADIIFAYQGGDFIFDSICGKPARLIELEPETAKASLAINVYLADGRFEYTAEYDRTLYSRALLESMVDAMMAAAEAFLSTEALKTVSIMSPASEKLYGIMNDTDCKVESTLCHEFVEHWAAETPDALAVVSNGETLTFRELNESANIMAHRLNELGVSAENIIGLVLERSKEVMIAELAVLKAGGAFLPMVPGYPDERIDYCLINADSPFVITTEDLKSQKNELFTADKPYRTLTVEELLRGDGADNLGLSVSPRQMAYCIYTSGSTGVPKGVMMEHRNFSNYVQVGGLPMNYYTAAEAKGSGLALSSISFDMSLSEIWLPLCCGKAVCMASEDEFHNPILLRDLMLKNNVQMMICTPSFLNSILDTPGFDKALKNLITVAVGAEAFPAALYSLLREAAPQLQIINGYGPTEASMCCSTKELNGGGGITIGRPVGNARFYVLDKAGNIQPTCAEGELVICGAGVGRGYIKLPEKTAASFFELRGLPAYRSGDKVRLTGAAEIEFGGRVDNQVKLRGFRIELDEIEKVMCGYGTVRQSKVVVRNNGSEDYLAGFFTAADNVDIDNLTAYLKTRLTYYMVPAVLMQLEQMPMTPNGKIDKNAFPETKQSPRRSGGRKAAKKSLEQRLCEMFATVLGIEEVYADDNFFELGGTSLSASKITMMLMSDNVEVKYGDIFDNPTPEGLAEFIQKRDAVESAAPESAPAVESNTREALKWNVVKYTPEVKREQLGNILLTGAVGFLGIHILKELLEIEEGHIYCLVRKGSYASPEDRLRTMLFYYFSDGFEEALRNRITLIDADITDTGLGEALAEVPFDTVINCAACVKHFTDDDILERVNVRGVENLISICKERDKKLIQISTTSIAGIHTKETYEKQIKLHENEFFVIDNTDNKYCISKYQAEERMYDAIESGMRGKVMRAGNLMGRYSDGEFQANLRTNMFLSGIRGFAAMGKYPVSHMTDPMCFSPIDCTARAMVLLAGTNDKFTAFNCSNRYGFDEMKIIDACNRNGITILPEDDEIYYAEFRERLGDIKFNSKLNGLAAYDLPDAHAVEPDTLFTANVLYRIGFSWPLVDDAYLDRAINSIMTLDYFDDLGDREEY